MKMQQAVSGKLQALSTVQGLVWSANRYKGRGNWRPGQPEGSKSSVSGELRFRYRLIQGIVVSSKCC